MLHSEPLPGANDFANEILRVRGESGSSGVWEEKSLPDLSAVYGDSAAFYSSSSAATLFIPQET